MKTVVHTLNQVAKRFAMSTTTLAAWTRTGKIPEPDVEIVSPGGDTLLMGWTDISVVEEAIKQRLQEPATRTYRASAVNRERAVARDGGGSVDEYSGSPF